MPHDVALGSIAPDPAGFLVAFGAGILSFLSPCVLPLVPGYVSMVSGASAVELAGGPPPDAHPHRIRLLRSILLFVGGFTVVFVVLGAAASGLGHALGTHKEFLTRLAGAVVVGLALLLVLSALPEDFWRGHSLWAGRVGRLASVRRIPLGRATVGFVTAPLAGMAFGFAWTPCVGPVLGGLLGLAATRSTLAGGMALLGVYSLGLGVPFVASGLAFGSVTRFLARARSALHAIHLASACSLLVFGILVLAGQVGWLSSEISQVMDALGLQRLTTS